MKTIIKYLLLLAIVTACTKAGDPFKPEPLVGNVFLEDNLFQTQTEIGSEAAIYISENDDADPYLLGVKADKDGNFKFDFQPTKGKLFLVGKIQKNGIWYKGSLDLPNTKPELKLNPEYPQGRLQVTVNNANGILKGADVYVFINEGQAQSITLEPKDFIQTKQPTNDKGISSFFGLGKNTYYVVAKKGELVTPISKVDFSQDDVDKKNTKNIALKFVTPTVSPKLIITALDGADERMANVDVFIFTSLSQAKSVEKDSTVNYIATQKTNTIGVATFANLKPGIPYYIAAKEVFKINKTLQARTAIKPSTITLDKTDISTDVLFQ